MRARIGIVVAAALLGAGTLAAPAGADPDLACVDDAMFASVPAGISFGDLQKVVTATSYGELWYSSGGWIQATYYGCGVDTVARFTLKHTSGVPGWFLVDKDWLTGAAVTRPARLVMRDAAGEIGPCGLYLHPVNSIGSPTTGRYAGSPGWREVPFEIECGEQGAVAATIRLTTLDGNGARDEVFSYPQDPSAFTMPTPTDPSYEGYKALNPCLLRADGRMRRPASGRPWLLPLGQHQVIVGVAGSVNAAAGDGHPYTTVVEERVVVGCTPQRRAWR